MKRIFVSIIVLIIITSCGPSTDVIQQTINQAVKQTLTALPSPTLRPSDTPIPTKTNTPTITSTFTPIFTPTFTLQPQEKTATMAAATKTKQALEKLITATLIAATKTKQAEGKVKTATSVAATKTRIAEFQPIHYKELRDYPDNHTGELVKIKGRIMQIIQGRDMLLYFAGTYDLFYVSFTSSYSGVYENNEITVFGKVIGTYCYDTVAGGTNCVPKLTGYWFEK
jgi:hypothetical protein